MSEAPKGQVLLLPTQLPGTWPCCPGDRLPLPVHRIQVYTSVTTLKHALLKTQEQVLNLPAHAQTAGVSLK